jgi:hypothetical protein
LAQNTFRRANLSKLIGHIFRAVSHVEESVYEMLAPADTKLVDLKLRGMSLKIADAKLEQVY